MREITYVKAFTEALMQLMAEDENVLVIGEDVAHYGGVFHAFDGLLKTYGDKRVIDTPISEMGFIGMGVGAAARGLRPVCDLMFFDFIGVAMDQLYNQAAKLKFMFGGDVSVPLTLTTAGGAGLSAGPQHSQSLEAWLAHVPGLKVVLPSSPYDMKGLMVAAVRDDNPVVVVLNKRMLGSRGPVPEEIYEIPLGQANVLRPGRDVTVIALGRMVPESMTAAEELAKEGNEVEVIDLRTVQPLDSATILASVRRTNRALVVHEAVTFGGIGAEVAAQIQEEAFDYLDAPVLRLGAPFAPVPFSPVLERAYIPDANRIVAGVQRLLKRTGADVAVEVLIPKLGLTMEYGLIEEWLVEPGTPVKPGDPLLRLATDKVDVEVEAKGSGLFHPAVESGAELPPGALIGWLLEAGEAPPGAGRARPPSSTASKQQPRKQQRPQHRPPRRRTPATTDACSPHPTPAASPASAASTSPSWPAPAPAAASSPPTSWMRSSHRKPPCRPARQPSHRWSAATPPRPA